MKCLKNWQNSSQFSLMCSWFPDGSVHGDGIYLYFAARQESRCISARCPELGSAGQNKGGRCVFSYTDLLRPSPTIFSLMGRFFHLSDFLTLETLEEPPWFLSFPFFLSFLHSFLPSVHFSLFSFSFFFLWLWSTLIFFKFVKVYLVYKPP